MKRTLSLLLSIVLTFTMVFGTFTFNVSAEVTGGTFKNSAGELSKEYYDSFDNWESETHTGKETATGVTEEGYDFFRRKNTLADGNPGTNYRAAAYSFVTKPGTNDKYIEFKDIASDGFKNQRYYFKSNMSAMAENEKLYISFDVINNDNNYVKDIVFTQNHPNVSGGKIKDFIKIKDGAAYMFGSATSDAVINTDTWYHIDMMYDSSKDDDNVKICINDGTTKVTEYYTQNIGTAIQTYVSIGFVIEHSEATDLYNSSFGIDNLRMLFYDDTSVASSKPVIKSIGSDGNIVSYDASEIEFKVEGNIPELKPEHIKLSPENSITGIDVTSDGGVYTVKAQLGEELLSWTEYTLELDNACMGSAKYVINSDGVPTGIEISKKFTVAPAPFSLKSPEFSVSGSTLSVETTFVNNTQDEKWAYFMLVTKDADGVVTNIETLSKKDITTGVNGEVIELTAANFNEGSAEFFVTDGYTNKPLFDVSYGYNYDETPYDESPVATSDAAEGEMILGDYNYTTNKLEVCLNAGSDAAGKSGVIYVYKRNTALKDNLIYADYVTTAENGSIKKELAFPSDITDTTGEYTITFIADGINLKKDFPIYDSSAAFGGNIVRANFDAKDKKYDDYYLKITSSLLEGSLGVGYTSTSFDENALNFKFTRSDKEANYRIQVYPGVGKQTTGVHTVKYKFYADKAKSDGTIDWRGGSATIIANRVSSSSSDNDGSYDISSLRANKWYEIQIVFDIDTTKKSYLTVTDIATGEVVIDESLAIKGTNGFTNMWMYTTYTTDTTVSNNLLWKDLQVMSDYGEQKPAIRYVGNDNVVDYGQNIVEFKISKNDGITKDNVFVTDNLGNVIKAKSIAVTEDMGEYIVTATLEKALSSSKTYNINVDAIGYEEYRELVDGEFVAVQPISREFTTPAAPIDIADPEITLSSSSVTFGSVISNSTSGTVDATTVLSVVSSDGITKSVTFDSESAFKNDKSFTNTNDFAEGDSAEYFVINGFANPAPLFDKTWAVNYDGTIAAIETAEPTAKALSKSIVLDEYEYNTKFDHLGNKIVVNLNTGANAPVEGVLYICSGSEVNAGSVIYANYVTVADDGTLLKEIKFDSSILNTTKTYTVAFYSNDVDGVIKNTFNVYNEADYLAYKRNNIYKNVKKASTFSGIKQIITGTDDMGNVVCDAWDVFSADADVSVYETLKNKENVYISLANTAGSLADYNALCRAFENLSNIQKKAESNPKPAGPSSNNKTPGGSSIGMTATVTPKPSDSTSSVSGGSVFADMSGHWGKKYAEALVARGIVNGYDDGSFRGDNSITRAELTKIVVEAFDVNASGTKSFGDVDSSSWYADYVSKAATAGVVSGFEDGSFGADKFVTRQDAVLMIYRAITLKQKLPEGYKFFGDEKDIQDYASEAIRCFGDLGIITGDGNNKFLPQNSITRAEMAAVICRALDYTESHLQ